MKKTSAFILSLLLLLSLFGCAADKPENDVSTAENKIDDPAWDELSSLGALVTEDGTRYALVTLPALFSEGATQELLDASAGYDYTAATLNEDGSITYKLTKQEHKDLLDSVEETIDETLAELVDEELYTYSKLEANEDYTVFDVTLDSAEYGELEEAMNRMFGILGGLRGQFSGHASDSVTVNYYAPDGVLICTQQSSAG